MAIRTGGEVTRLVAELGGTDDIRRETAIARLRVIGSRAIDPLSTVARTAAASEHRIAALRALEGIDDHRVTAAALATLSGSSSAVAIAAIAVLRPWLPREPDTDILEALTALAIDRAQDMTVRLAALDAISDLPANVVRPIFEHAAIEPKRTGAEDPAWVHEWLQEHAGAPLSELHALVTHAHDQERNERDPARQHEWTKARGAVHAALARRSSRVALYDLRESFDAAIHPLPLDFLTAVATIGDVTCLEPLARAWAAAPNEPAWRERLADAARDVMQRERLTGRSGAIKRLRARFAGFV